MRPRFILKLFGLIDFLLRSCVCQSDKVFATVHWCLLHEQYKGVRTEHCCCEPWDQRQLVTSFVVASSRQWQTKSQQKILLMARMKCSVPRHGDLGSDSPKHTPWFVGRHASPEIMQWFPRRECFEAVPHPKHLKPWSVRVPCITMKCRAPLASERKGRANCCKQISFLTFAILSVFRLSVFLFQICNPGFCQIRSWTRTVLEISAIDTWAWEEWNYLSGDICFQLSLVESCSLWTNSILLFRCLCPSLFGHSRAHSQLCTSRRTGQAIFFVLFGWETFGSFECHKDLSDEYRYVEKLATFTPKNSLPFDVLCSSWEKCSLQHALRPFSLQANKRKDGPVERTFRITMNSSINNGTVASNNVSILMKNNSADMSTGNKMFANGEIETSIKITISYKMFVLLFGLIGNCLTIFVVRRTKTPITTRIIITSLAVSDNGFLLFAAPLTTVNAIYKGFHHTSVSCQFSLFVHYFFPNISNYLLVILTAERATAVALPLRVKSFNSGRKFSLLLTVVVFAISAWASFVAYNFDAMEKKTPQGVLLVCAPRKETYFQAFQVVSGVVENAIPLIAVVGGNIVIIVCYSRNKKRTRNITETAGTDNRKLAEAKLFVTTLCVSVAFAVLSTPLTLYFTVGERILGNKIYSNRNNPFRLVAECMNYTNFGINFYLYVLFAESFRKEMRVIGKKLRDRFTNDDSANISVPTSSEQVSWVSYLPALHCTCVWKDLDFVSQNSIRKIPAPSAQKDQFK